ncbi:MAG: Hsp20/alpha crystallin family protein [Bacillus sp. (in: firmicutes)]
MKPIRRHSGKHDNQIQKADFDRFIQRFFDDSFFFSSDSFFGDSLTPSMNIKEQKENYDIELEVPGVDSDDVDIELEGNVMTVKAEKTHKSDKKDEDSKMHIIEHSYGSFYRSFTLPDNIDSSNITAECKNGVLNITVPKKEKSVAKRIDVKKKDN